MNKSKPTEKTKIPIKDWYLELTEEEKTQIEIARKQFLKGETLTSAEFWNGLK